MLFAVTLAASVGWIAPIGRRHVLAQNIVGPAKMPSVFASAGLLGGSVEISYAHQIAVALGSRLR